MTKETCARKEYKLWSKEDIEFLKGNYRKIPVKLISEKIKRSESAIKNKAFGLNLSTDYKNENNPRWNEKSTDYDGIHGWVRRRLKRPDICPKCGKRPKRMDLCYKDHTKGRKDVYKRDLSMWKYLCRKCHMEEDGRINNLKQFKPKTKGCGKRCYSDIWENELLCGKYWTCPECSNHSHQNKSEELYTSNAVDKESEYRSEGKSEVTRYRDQFKQASDALRGDDEPLSSKKFLTDTWEQEIFLKKDVRSAVNEDYKNTVLAKRGEISWQEYARRRIKTFGKELSE